jgi:hypothetical protein
MLRHGGYSNLVREVLLWVVCCAIIAATIWYSKTSQ